MAICDVLIKRESHLLGGFIARQQNVMARRVLDYVANRVSSLCVRYVTLGLLVLMAGGCSKTEMISGEVFSTSLGESRYTYPHVGVQVYFFTEKQKTRFEKDLSIWRRQHFLWAYNSELGHEWSALSHRYTDEDGSLIMDKIPAEERQKAAELMAIRERFSESFWGDKYPTVLNGNEDKYSDWDFDTIAYDAVWAVTDTNGKFEVSLKLGKIYWVWCSGSSASSPGFVESPWFFKYVPDGGKLVLTNVNRLK